VDKKGENKTLPSNTGRNRVNINGAYCIENHKLIYRQDESINTQSTIALLDQIKAGQKFGQKIIISDNARYYKSKLLKEYLNKNTRITMEYLPPYSPNLNIIERLWRFIKRKVTYNKYYEKFSVFEEKCCTFFLNLSDFKPELETLMTDNFQKLQYCRNRNFYSR
jgi:transposase